LQGLNVEAGWPILAGMQMLDVARSRPYTDLLATLDELVTVPDPVPHGGPSPARARYDAMVAVIAEAQNMPVTVEDPPRRSRPASDRWRGRRTG
jgi:hypothetical protein